MPQSAQQQLKNWLNDIDRAVDKFDKRDKKSILRKGAALIRKDARTEVPVRGSDGKRTFLNPRYKYRGKGRGRSPKGKGKIVAYYVPGNLRKSVQTLTFRRSSDVFVGPKFTRKKLPVYGRRVSSADGYYAQMLYGSAARFRAKVLIPARNKNAEEIRATVLKAVKTKIPQYVLSKR